jgi:type I restriction enzyme, R subunit
MSNVGQPERATQERVIALFRNELSYRYLDDWTDRDANSDIEEVILTDCLTRSGYTRTDRCGHLQAPHRSGESGHDNR